ncbi:MAG TPA: sulfotransferase [Acidimicrobiales bacterium]|nr:sulfotransferase [Acidimicrobiales bacterium]
MRVIGAGLGRTGTHSLKVALEQLLGGRCHHMVEVFAHPEEIPVWTDAIEGRPVDWRALLGGYTSVVDWPGAAFWPELSAVYPDALMLLSVRDPDAWYESAINTIFAGLRRGDEEIGPWMVSMVRLLGDRFCNRFDDRDAMIEAFVRHNDAVRRAVPAERLLEWSTADGWAPICDRLGLPTPGEPFPVTNTTEEFRAMMGLPPA